MNNTKSILVYIKEHLKLKHVKSYIYMEFDNF